MADDRDNLIRSRAYELWEAEGTPHGRHDDHWAQASREIAEAQDEASDRPAPAEGPVPSRDETMPATEAAVEPVAPAKRARKAAVVAAPVAPKGRRKKDG